ncbi:MAG: tRNA (N6-isopentenyl adenosine(37)-C2)-methylthiotransferase MiaB [Flavobacteriales bacterium]
MKKKIYIETYGCQMNFSDSEIVASILQDSGYASTNDAGQADVILLNTCSVRDNAEKKVRNRLSQFHALKRSNPGLVLGVLGCMAERIKTKLLEDEQLLDMVVGPDAYRDLPGLIKRAENGRSAVNVVLSSEETYADICPVRLHNNVSAFISITRGCDNMCAFCVVPFTRGRERSRNPETIAVEAAALFEKGCREITLLGQNVDSYLWFGGGPKIQFAQRAKGTAVVNFAELLEMVAETDPKLWVRFSTSHPKDLTDEVLRVMAKHDNICKHIHLPIQSGNDEILIKMKRGYTVGWYMSRIEAIQTIVPDCAISTDIIAGFCGETEEQHRDTLRIMEAVKYYTAYMFMYSDRPGTLANRQMTDDVPVEVKKKRLKEIIALQQQHSTTRNEEAMNKEHRVLVEDVSKRSDEHYFGRNSQNTVFVFPKRNAKVGDFVHITPHSCTAATIIGDHAEKNVMYQ